MTTGDESMPPRAIAVAQTSPVRDGLQANIDEHVRLAEMAASDGAEIVLFPELSLTGYELHTAADLAFEENDPRLRRITEAANRLSVTLVVGAPVAIGDGLHIGALVVRPGAAAPAVYTKRHLGAFSESVCAPASPPPAEASVFTAGTRDPLIELQDDVAAIAICADVGHGSHIERAVSRGATVYLASMFVIPAEFDRDARRLREYAKAHSMLVALSNFGDSTGGLDAAGCSSIWSERGELLAQLPVRGAGVASVRRTPRGWAATTLLGPGVRSG